MAASDTFNLFISGDFAQMYGGFTPLAAASMNVTSWLDITTQHVSTLALGCHCVWRKGE
jgi:hypothetical protein